MTFNLIKKEFNPGFWFFQIAGWIGFAITDALIGAAHFITSFRNFIIWLISVLVGVLITQFLRIYYRHFFSKGPGIFKVIVLILSGSLAAALLWQFLGDLVRYLTFPAYYVPSYEPGRFIIRIYSLLWVFLVWSILYFGIKFWVNMMEEKIRAAKADADTRKAQLQMLRYQINPHFLFNTLNSIRALVRRESEVAEIMITEFSDFLRYTFRHNDKTFILLEEEIEIVRKYLLLEKIRFENRLIYSFEISLDTLKIPVLCFLLQPFVENAIKHGLRKSQSGISVVIRSGIENNTLYLEIENSGSWIPEDNNSGSGISNVTERLATAYPGNHTFEIEKGERMVRVTISINLRNENIPGSDN